MSLTHVLKLLRDASCFEAKALRARLQAQRADQLQKRLARQLEALRGRLANVSAAHVRAVLRFGDYEQSALAAMDAARLAYTADMDGPSEERRDAWEAFLATQDERRETWRAYKAGREGNSPTKDKG